MQAFKNENNKRCSSGFNKATEVVFKNQGIQHVELFSPNVFILNINTLDHYHSMLYDLLMCDFHKRTDFHKLQYAHIFELTHSFIVITNGCNIWNLSNSAINVLQSQEAGVLLQHTFCHDHQKKLFLSDIRSRNFHPGDKMLSTCPL